MKISHVSIRSTPIISSNPPLNLKNHHDSVQINFKGYDEALDYAKKTRFKNKIFNKKLCDLDFEKLEGIQQGLKSFEGCSIKQIAFALTDLHSINMVSGCKNHCLHCYANAQPFIKRYPFEDLEQFCKDVKELRSRLGVNPVHHHGAPYIDCYFDADGMDCYLFDKNGKKRDIIEISKMMHDCLGYKTVFDTNGWARSDKEKQAGAEEIVQKFLENQNYKNFYQINVSINPFNPKYVSALNSGYPIKNLYGVIRKVGDEFEKEEAALPADFKKARAKYTEYILDTANVLYTFKPLLNTGKLGVIVRAFDNKITEMAGFRTADFEQVLGDIMQTLYLCYGLCGLISNKELDKYADLLTHCSTNIFTSGRMEKFYKVKNPDNFGLIERIDDQRANSKLNFERLMADKKTSGLKFRYLKMIAPDGKVYLYDNYAIIPTDIQFNTSTKALSKPFSIPVKNFKLTEEMVDFI